MNTLSAELSQLFSNAILQVAGKKVGPLRYEQAIAELGLDSIAVMELVGTLEEQLGLHFNDDELTKLNTFGDLASLVERYQLQKSA